MIFYAKCELRIYHICYYYDCTHAVSATASFKDCTGGHNRPRISHSLLQGLHRRTLPTKDQPQPPSDCIGGHDLQFQGSATDSFKDCTGGHGRPRFSHTSFKDCIGGHDLQFQGSAPASFKVCTGEHDQPSISYCLGSQSGQFHPPGGGEKISVWGEAKLGKGGRHGGIRIS